MTKNDWRELLRACAGDLSEALPAAGELAQTATVLEDSLPELPPNAPYAMVPVFAGPEGSVVLTRWAAALETPPHAIEAGRVLHCLLTGELHEHAWAWRDERLVHVGTRRIKHTDVLLSRPPWVQSFVSPDGASALSVYTSEVESLRVYPKGTGPGVSVPVTAGAWTPPRSGSASGSARQDSATR